MNEFVVGDEIQFRHSPSNKKGIVTRVNTTRKSPYIYWVESEDEEGGYEGEYYSKSELILIGGGKLRQQTEMFWLLQLQFMQMSPYNLLSMYDSIRYTSAYRENEMTRKMTQLLRVSTEVFSESNHLTLMAERDCIATHLALQFAGVEE